jgi:hypothetical protein
LFKENELQEIITIFDERKSRLFHACQLKDLESYLKLGGVPSRALLESSNLTFTKFRSDQHDQNNEVWNKVFFNLNDYGEYFHKMMSSSTPTVYGPILLEFKASALDQCKDLAVCFRSAGHPEFNRENESLTSTEEVKLLYSNPLNHIYSSNIKFTPQLRNDFPNKLVTGQPELSATMPNNLLSFEYLMGCKVDPLNYNGIHLIDTVKNLVEQSNDNFSNEVKERYSKREAMYNELINTISSGTVTLNQISANESLSQVLRRWAKVTEEKKLEFTAFQPFQNYLRNGTLSRLLELNPGAESA